MTNLEILKLAKHGALEIWSREYDRCRENPNNAIIACKERKYYEQLVEIISMISKEEQKAQ